MSHLNFEETTLILKKYNQDHLISFYNKLNNADRHYLLKQLNSINYREILKPIQRKKNDYSLISPLNGERWEDLSLTEKNKCFEKGIEILKNKKVAIVLLAGGQGTRLAHNGPKGTYNINLPTINSLFELQTKWLILYKNKLGVNIPWYIMTSNENHNETVNFFKDNNYFGYDKESIHFFKQNNVPALSSENKILMKNKKEILFVPDGNGGVFKTLYDTGLLQSMKEDGIDWVFINNIDNILVKIADPKFIGYAALKNNSIASKSVVRRSPNEPVGIICKADNKPTVIEYSDLDDAVKYKKNNHDILTYNDANIGIHLFKIDFLLNNSLNEMPYHIATKHFNSIDFNGNLKVIKNGIKLERFLFDVFSYAEEMSVLRVNREEEFAPIKNAVGKDSPQEAKEMFMNYQKIQGFQNEFGIELFNNY